MNPSNRRQFLQQTALLAGAASIAPSFGERGANDKIVLGIIGPGGMGTHHLKAFSEYKDVEIAYVCDPDEKRMQAAVVNVEKISGKAPKPVKDLRRVIEDKAVDAVVVATPDHWHVPASLLALEAGKNVKNSLSTTTRRINCLAEPTAKAIGPGRKWLGRVNVP